MVTVFGLCGDCFVFTCLSFRCTLPYHFPIYTIVSSVVHVARCYNESNWPRGCACMHVYTESMYNNIRFPQIFLGQPGAYARNVYQALPPLTEGPGYEAR